MLTVTLLIGCDEKPQKPQAVVINMGLIAKAMGINEQIKEHIETMNHQISEEMKALSADLNNKFEYEKASLDDSPSEEDKKRY